MRHYFFGNIGHACRRAARPPERVRRPAEVGASRYDWSRNET